MLSIPQVPMTTYKGFIPLSDNRYIKDPRSDKQSDFLLRIPLYEGIQDSPDPAPTKYFCFLGKTYGGLFIELSTLESRLDVDVRKQDYETLCADPHARLFYVWDSKGGLATVPSSLLIDPTLYPDFEKWDEKQEKQWVKLFAAVDDARPSLPFNVYTRFIQPSADQIKQIKLFFTPAPQPFVFDLDKLKAVFQAAFSNETLKLPKYNYDVIKWEDAEKEGLVLTGEHYFHFYFTWMTQSDFIKLWATFQKRPELMRPWPTSGIADSIDFKIHHQQKGPRGSGVTTAKMSHFKALSATGKRDHYDDQKTVMGSSATELAEMMWEKKTLTGGSPADAEWLHRNAFHFGGMSDTVDLASSQTRENLVFGTGECNTSMIRAENAITSLLKADALLAKNDKRSGTLVTVNMFKGSMKRLDLESTDSRKEDQIPSWVDKERYMWLCLGLKYKWEMNGTELNGLPFNAYTVFDPFSRYIPFRVEARLDDALMDELYQQSLATTTSSTTQVTARMARSVARETLEMANSPALLTSPLYQEPTILWNAAQNHLPYVYIGSSKIFHPGIGEPPISEDLPSDEPIIHVIGVDSLFSPLPEDAPVKATRVVEIRPQRQPLTRIARAPVTAAPASTRSLLPPIFSSPISATLPPSQGFIAVGEIELFGQPSLRAQFEKWEGPPPSDVVVRPDTPISVERASLTNDFHFSSIISALQGTAFDDIVFRNVSVFHQNYQFEVTKRIGWHFSADLVIDESCGGLRDLLSKALGVDEPTLSVYAFLGTSGGWDKPPVLHSFTLEGVFAGIALKPMDGIILSQIGVRLFGVRTLKFDPTPRMALEFGFSVFGSMDVDVPGSIVPLSLDYEIQEYSGTVSLGAVVNVWKNPLGIDGFTLRNTSFSTSFALSSPWKSFVFDVSADFMYKDVLASFEGSYAPGGSCDMSASIRDVRLDTIDTLFEWITNNHLSLPDVGISIGTARISISSGKGLDISLDNVVIGDYKSLNAGLTFTSRNVLLRGDLTSDVIQFGDIELKRAFLQVTLEARGNSKQTDVIVGGEIVFSSLALDVAVHLYRSPDASQKSLEWTVLAALTVADNSLALSKVVPEVEGTPFDLVLTHAVFVAASRDDPSLGNMITSGYSFHQGVQVCAVLSELDALNSLMRGPVPGLILSAGWSRARGFELDVYLPTPTSLNFGNGITTTPFTLAIQTKPVQLILAAGLKVPVAYSPTPLLFTLSLGTNLLGASATGQMSGWWVNPFGIGQNVKIGPNLALSIDIIFAQFVSTGTPSGFALQGGLMIGKTQAQVALSINEDPMKELLYAEVQSLNLTDVTTFAGDIIGVVIPEPPQGFLDFKEVKLYICPAGVTIGATFYPQGFSFQAEMILFGKRADIACVVGTSQISIKGGVDNFTVGPLTVRGTTGPRAVIECEVGLVVQHLLIDGVVSLFDAESTVHVEVDVLPEPKFAFYTQLKFTDLLLFQLNASLIGSLNFTDLSDADFLFDALFEQHILEYIHNHVILQFDQARKAAEDGIDAAQKAVDDAEAEWKNGMDRAQAGLDAAKKTWDEKNENVKAESNKIIDAYNKEIDHLQNAISDAQKDYDLAMTNAESAVEAANRDRSQALQSAQHAVDNAKQDMNDAIDQAEKDVDNAERALHEAFGFAQDAIESARRNVQSLQDQIDDLYRTIHEYEDAPWYDFPKKVAIGGLYLAVGGLEASKAIADGVLQAAEAVLTSADYIAKETVFNAAQGALETARAIGQAALDTAQGSLQAADAASQAVLDAAEATLEGVKNGVEWGVLQGAKEALRVYKEANEAAFRAATQALVDLAACVEFLAYQAAKTALDIARAATVTLETAKKALEFAREVGEEALTIGKWVADRALGLFDIRVVHLSGSLRGMVAAGGKMSKPFTAHIEGVLLDEAFTLYGEYDPGKTADFITYIFKDLWEKIKVIV